jgi:hypothetical protein
VFERFPRAGGLSALVLFGEQIILNGQDVGLVVNDEDLRRVVLVQRQGRSAYDGHRLPPDLLRVLLRSHSIEIWSVKPAVIVSCARARADLPVMKEFRSIEVRGADGCYYTKVRFAIYIFNAIS